MRLVCCGDEQRHHGLKCFKPDVDVDSDHSITEELIKEALEMVLDARTHPILIMCAYVTPLPFCCPPSFRRLSFADICIALHAGPACMRQALWSVA
jgi:hypothetical protein